MSRLGELRPTAAELREMVQLAGPIVLVNLGLQLMGVVDSMMLGRVSPVALAAGALGNFYFHLTALAGLGVLMSIDPVVAQAIGAKDDAAVARGVQRGILLALGVSMAVMLSFLPAGPVLRLLQQPADVIPLATSYVLWSIPGLLPFFLFAVLRQSLQAMHRIAPIVFAVVIANVANAVLNWMLIFGHWGFAAGGVTGASQATVVSRWMMAGVLLLAGWPALRSSLRPWRAESFAWRPLLATFVLGLPIGLSFFSEGGAFGLVTVMTGWMGTPTLAGHEIALNLASMTFMVPLGVAGAAAVMVGRAVGAGDTAASRRDAVAALVCGVGFMTFTAVCFVLAPRAFAALYTADVETLRIAVLLIPIAGVFQVFDGMQVVGGAVLRGSGDTRVPMILHVLSFWALGIPLGAWLAFAQDHGAVGLWWGLTAGLAAAGLLVLLRIRHRFRGEVARLVLDGPSERSSFDQRSG